MCEREEYTPTTDEVRNNMALGVAVAQACADDGHPDLPQNIDWPMGSARPAAKKQFDSWLSAHDRALRDQIERLQATVHVLTSERDAALVRNDDLIVTHSAECEQAWREGYYTGKRDYAGSVMGGTPISTPNPYTARIARGEGSE